MTSKLNQLVTFKIGRETYGVDIMQVQEIILMTEITSVPEAEGVEGVINLRGTIVPIIDLRKRFHSQPATNRETSRIMVINLNQNTVGMIVDEVCQVLKINQNDLQAPPKSISQGQNYLKGIINLDSHILIVLQFDQLITPENMVLNSNEEAVHA